ncbi:MAG: biotin/lipoyl-containing protein [Acidobacteriota bacterium]
MTTKNYTCKVQQNEGEITILSPAVGIFRKKFKNGDFLCNNAHIGNITILNKDYNVFLPENISGIISFMDDNRIEIPVGYKDKLFSLKDPGSLKKIETKPSENENVSSGNDIIIKAFTTGIFYRKPAPESPPFVEKGSVIKRGELLGLIEVMKSFNQIIFSKESDMEEGIIKKILVEDSREVKSGDPLFIISKVHGGKK